MEDVWILVVDDEENILTIFRLILESAGYRVDTASTAGEALGKVRVNQFSLCLLDLNLPDMHGTELLRELHSVAPKMKKLVVTGESSTVDTGTVRSSGADGVIIKPVNKARLISIVEEVLRKN